MTVNTIVITGGIGSGKSTIINKIKQTAQTKVDFFSFDEYTKQQYDCPKVKEFLITMFGTDDRTRISDIVFKCPEMREALNSYFRCFVEDKFLELVNRKSPHNLVIEFPLFFEMMEVTPSMQLVRSKVKVVAVTCDEEIRKARVIARDGFNSEKVDAIIASQKSDQYKISNSDYCVDTAGNTDENVVSLMTTKFKKVFFHDE